MGVVEDLEWSIDIVELVSKYSKIKKAGANYKGLCPFPGHNEKTPSFVVSPAKQIGYCFGCHRGGWAVKFIMDIENCEFKEALDILANITGKSINNNFDAEKYKAQKNIYGLYKDATTYYKQALNRYPEMKKYLMERWFSWESLENFHLWYADSGIDLYNYLKEKWYEDNLIEESKIFIDLARKKDKFINRIVFPIQNGRWDFVAFTGRVVGQWEPKYLNSPASEYYDKSSILYGLYSARHTITKLDYVIVTEWNPDVIAMQQYGFTNTVAVSGTALTDKHLTILKRLTHRIYLCFDNDKAGINATKLSLENMKNKGFEVKIISLAWWKDPDEILKSGQDFQPYIDNAMTPIGFYLKQSKFDPENLDEKKKLLKELIEIVKSYSDNIEKDFYLKEISKLLDINAKIVYDLFNRTRIKSSDVDENSQVKSQNVTSEDLAIWYIMNDNRYISEIKQKIIFPESISTHLQNILDKGTDYLETLEISEKERYKWIALRVEMDNKHTTQEHFHDEIEKLILWMNREIYKKEVENLKNKISQWDAQALKNYSELVKIAKSHGIK